ncbi:MAG TPA: hypothetical protein VHT03_07760, partial [Rhizomicrobium sp.]|nr:hypothetical protein [Rhizomicrobium sp.]
MKFLSEQDKSPIERVDDFVVFTIVANNYLSYAKTLMQSVEATHPGSRRFIILCDELSGEASYDAPAEILLAQNLGIGDF